MKGQISNILNAMSEFLNVKQMKKLQQVLILHLDEARQETENISNEQYLEMFLNAKQIEGCSTRTIQYYRMTAEHLLKCVKIPIRQMSTESIEILRDNCEEKRDLAIIDLLFSTGMRVGELVNLDIADIDFNERECVVYGKGDKERRVYFDAKAKLHLQNYLKCRHDNNPALFVTLNQPNKRLKISGVEIRLRMLGRSLDLERIHPHKFRRTMATRAIDKGMPIEQVQKLLGHQQIDTTMQYAMVNQSNVKSSHRKFIA